MNELVGFFAGSGLKLNNLKTELVNHNGRDAQVTVNQQGDVQQSAKTARLLGIIIDSNLNFHPHIDLLLKEMEYRMWQFRKISKIADRRNRLIYGHGLLFSKFVYGIQCYAGTDGTYLEKVRVAYDKCVRLIYGENPDNIRTEQMRSEMGILSFENLVVMMDVTLLRDIIFRQKPERLAEHFEITYTRNFPYGRVRVKLIPKTEKFRRSFIFRAANSWNALPNEFKILSRKQFHDKVKVFLLGGLQPD